MGAFHLWKPAERRTPPTHGARRLSTRCTLLLVALSLLLLAGAGKGRGKQAKLQMSFGVDMAQRGSWKEAQYRFERAIAVAPADAEILNNLAVAYENNGRYGEAGERYLQALEHAPENEKIRANYERFRIFYTGYLEELERDAARQEGLLAGEVEAGPADREEAP